LTWTLVAPATAARIKPDAYAALSDLTTEIFTR
jgi:hypothetical protein